MDALDKLQRCTTPGIRADFDFLSFGKLYAKMQLIYVDFRSKENKSIVRTIPIENK